jgi:prolipoprotein diacylglyceryltransferase
VAHINTFLDSLPRARFGSRTREVPAFRTIGIAGFYIALLVTLGTGLATGRSPVVLYIVAAVCGLSFFVWAFVRRAITGRETLVLFEHVWIALAASAVTLAALAVPVLAYLDDVALGVCAFLAIGRIGCLVAGCCFGQPSVVGITYGQAAVDDGFPAGLAGVRLFPVQLVESAGIALIGLTGALVLAFLTPGTVFVWFLLGYAVLRFGTEGLRGDDRASVAGLSVPRWAAIVQGAVALAIVDPTRMLGPVGLVLAIGAASAVAAGAAWRHRPSVRALQDPAEVAAVRRFIEERAAVAMSRSRQAPEASLFHGGLSVVASSLDRADGLRLHVSFALPLGRRSLRSLADVAEAALPETIRGSARVGPNGTLHVEAGLPLAGRPARSSIEMTGRIYREALLSLQVEESAAIEADRPGQVEEGARGRVAGPTPINLDGLRRSYFVASHPSRDGAATIAE